MSEETKIDLVTINVDGRDVDVPAGMNLIDAVKKYANVEIPHYCYHNKLSVAGNCRMCLVEMGMPMRDRATGEVITEDGKPKIGWMPKPAIACSTKTSPGLHIKTQSEMVKECRNGVMEFLLVNHPLDCPICDQAGECRLQEFSTDYGRGYSRYIEEKNVKPKRSRIGPRVTLDDERCILCSRCVRFSREITKDAVLGFVDRGSYSTLTCYPGKELDNNYSLNVVDLCPVGALTDTDFRFKMRVWFLKPTKSICTESSVGVNTEVWSREGKIYRITPRQNDAVNDAWMSDSGRKLYSKVETEFRLFDASISGSPVAYTDAIAKATALLKSEKVGIVGSGHSTVEEDHVLKDLADKIEAEAWLVPHVEDGDGFLISSDRTPNTRGAILTGLIRETPYQHIDKLSSVLKKGEIKTLLVVNEDLVAAGVDEALLKGVDIIYVGTEENETSKLATVVIPSLTVFEKAGSFVNQNFRIQKFAAAIPGLKGVYPDLVTFAKLAEAVGCENVASTIGGVWSSIQTTIPELAALSYQSVPEEGAILDASRFSKLEFCEGKTLHYAGKLEEVANA